jgi:hypothetical protein
MIQNLQPLFLHRLCSQSDQRPFIQASKSDLHHEPPLRFSVGGIRTGARSAFKDLLPESWFGIGAAGSVVDDRLGFGLVFDVVFQAASMIDRCLNAAITSFEIFFRPLSS